MPKDWRCRLGLHVFPWPAHYRPRLWDDFDVECARGCGARTVKTCVDRWHWRDKHPEPKDGAD